MAQVRIQKTRTTEKDRVNKLRAKILCQPEICLERSYWLTQSYKETESDPAVIRRAKALQKILGQMTIGIDDGELIVGRATSKVRGGPLIPEVQWAWYLDEMELLSTREWDRFAPLSAEDKAKMKDFLPYWKGKSLYDKWHAIIPENLVKLKHVIQAPISSCINNMHLAHICPDYERVISKGLENVRSQVQQELKKLNPAIIKDFEKIQFLNAVEITLDAAIKFASRYAQLAREMALKEKDNVRKAELEKIAEICDRVPGKPARSFYEAMQSVWLTHIVLMMEGWGPGVNFGRADQYLYPFYRKDIEEKKITREEARELISLLYIKMNGLVTPQGSEIVKTFAGHPIWANVTLGGLTVDGRDAVNELSYIFLEAEENVGLTAEDLVIRIHKNTPEAFVLKACEVARLLRGKLKFLSDETTIQQLLKDGKPIEYARDYMVAGCHMPTIPGRSQDMGGQMFNLPLMLELALNNGVSRLSGQQVGPQTGDAKKFQSYNEVWEAYKKQVEALLQVLVIYRNTDRQLFAEYCPTPFQSALYHGCIEKGVDITNGGTAPYFSQFFSLAGVPNVGDSLAAIKKAVFEDKKITMDQLVTALDNNFEAGDKILHILESAPKFGNDDDYVDSIVNDVISHGSEEAAKYKGIAGAPTTSAACMVTANVPMGFIVGALPDGRKSGEPLAEGGISPYQGRNISGPTATMRSVAKLDHSKLTGGSVLNMRFNPEVIKDQPSMKKFASLIRTFLETGGALVQFNIVNTETLKDAKKHPENYRDLLVRVATYSAYFVELGPELQDDIISRMELQEI
jgi:choline trimethylamine-lyase